MLLRLALGASLLAFCNNHFDLGLDRVADLPALRSLSEIPGSLLGDQGEIGVPYAFTDQDAQGPLRWHTCAPVPVLVNPGPTGEMGLAEIRQALVMVGVASGVRFEVVGTTDAVPQRTWAANGQVVDGWPYPAVLIAWVPEDSTDLLGGAESGSAVANPAAYQGVRQIVSGAVALNSDDLGLYTPGFGPGSTRGNLVLHELGHLVGLGHVNADTLMNPEVGDRSPDGFGAAELEGLARLAPRCG